MRKVQRRRSQTCGKERDLFQLLNGVSTNAHLDSKRNAGHKAARERSYHSFKRSRTTPGIMSLGSGSIQTECDMSNRFSMRQDAWPHSVEMPAVSDKANL